MGQAGSNEQDASLPQRVRIPAPGAPASVQNGTPILKRGPCSLVQSLFGLDVQVPPHPHPDPLLSLFTAYEAFIPEGLSSLLLYCSRAAM